MLDAFHLGGLKIMTEKRFIRNIIGQIYDNENEKFYHEDYEGKPLEYDDEIIVLLNKLDEDNKQYKILVESLKNENQKLKLRLKDLGVEYF